MKLRTTSQNDSGELSNTLPGDDGEAPLCATTRSFDECATKELPPSRTRTIVPSAVLASLDTGNVPGGKGAKRHTRSTQKTSDPDKKDTGGGASSRGAGRRGGQPPPRHPPAAPGDASDDAAGDAAVKQALSNITYNPARGQQGTPRFALLATGIAAASPLAYPAIKEILTRLGEQAVALIYEQQAALNIPLFVPDVRDAVVEAVLSALERHIANHPPFDDAQFSRTIYHLTDHDIYHLLPAVAACMTALASHVRSSNNALSVASTDRFMLKALDVLRDQSANPQAEQLCGALAPMIEVRCTNYAPRNVAELLVLQGLPALQNQPGNPGNLALLRALIPYVHRFFNEILPALQDSANASSDIQGMRQTFDMHLSYFHGYPQGFDVLDALRGLRHLHAAPGSPPMPELVLILDAVDKAVRERALGKAYSPVIEARVLPRRQDKLDTRPERVLANLIEHLQEHFPLAGATRLVMSTHAWLDIDPEKVALDPAQLTNADYRSGLIDQLLSSATDSA